MKRSTFIMVTGIICLFTLSIFQTPASAEMNKFMSELVWRADGRGDYIFQGNGTLRGVKVAADGAVEYDSAPGTYELNNPCSTDGLILSLTANWTFTGKVTLQVSATGRTDDYIAVTNGVPYKYNSNFGSKIKWRAILAGGSRLNSVRITYKDMAGTAGSWGNPKLCAFGFRKALFIDGSKIGELFNYQVPVKVGAAQAENCDFTLKAALDLQNVCFTQADAETILPHYLESTSGEAVNKRSASFWVKIPQIPLEGLPIYIYYGRPGGENLSNGKEAFDLFEDFGSGSLDTEVWKAYDFKQGILEYKLKSKDEIKSLDTAKLTPDEILAFFKEGKDFEWARARQSVSPAPLVDKERTDIYLEEATDLADFAGIEVAPDGDLVLAEGSSRGEYTSASIPSSFKVRIVAPEYKTSIADGSSASVDISADAGKDFKADCISDKYYYASRKDFSSGDSMKWRLRLARSSITRPGSRLKEISLDFRPGVISVISPEAEERLTAGGTYNIRWSAQEYEPSYVMGIAYSLDGGKKYSVITENALNTEKYLWRVPQTTCNKALIKVYDKLDPSINAVSGGYFAIEQGLGVRGQGSEEVPASVVAKSPEAADLSSEALPKLSSLRAKEEAISISKDKAKNAAGIYELLIKLDDRTPGAKKTLPGNKGSYEEGDIVVIKPAGYLWGSEERSGKFVIVRSMLRAQEVKDFTSPKVAASDKKDDKDRPATRIDKKRRFKIDLVKQGIVDADTLALKRAPSDEPVVLTREAVEEKK